VEVRKKELYCAAAVSTCATLRPATVRRTGCPNQAYGASPSAGYLSAIRRAASAMFPSSETQPPTRSGKSIRQFSHLAGLEKRIGHQNHSTLRSLSARSDQPPA